MKWEVIEPERGVFNWTGTDLVSLSRLDAQASDAKQGLMDRSSPKLSRSVGLFEDTTSAGISRRESRMITPLHCTDRCSPAYVTNITDPEELKTVLKEHIDAVLGRYADDLYAMDIINERKSAYTTVDHIERATS